MPLSLQVKLLRVLQEKEYERIGDTKTRKTDVRILAATNKDLLSMVQEGLFREDLFYRIHVLRLHIPSLRERVNDIPLLCEFFIEKFKTKNFKQIKGLTSSALVKLTSYNWPGNVRELENVLERAFHFSASNWIEADDIHLNVKRMQPYREKQQEHFKILPTVESLPRKELMNKTEKFVLIQALQKADGNRTKAAEILGISRSTLYQKLKKYRIKEELQFKLDDD